MYRKGWEYTHCLYGLNLLGAIHPGAVGLGVGVGHEPTIFYLAEHIKEVVATDLYDHPQWSANEATATVLTRPQDFCPRSVDLSRVRFQIAIGANLPFEDGCFDFCWSLSSIEHFGGHGEAAKAMCEIARVMRPGGIACIATEYILLEEKDHPEFFNRWDFEKYILNASPLLHQVDAVRYHDTLPIEYLIDSVTLWEGSGRTRRHVVMNDGEIQWTSIMVFMKKALAKRMETARLRLESRSAFFEVLLYQPD